ncbi:GFA family protein [Devosia rhodophyticola]|uniref:GFA family protein n=1 Tax=Devosia rhodophyticola TaxID=3026423 RepID=A0ABY7YYT9_9HYPH|nr:GFA family protein [Devosia rhodophyticola]WDR06531.1 GFA family protein [Devosia rhodophyticola]
MSEEKFHGSCQCGAVEYEVIGLNLTQTVTCNCSRCQRLGSVLAFAPRSNFSLLKGQEALSEYLFNKKAIRHQFCKVCGIQSFSFGATPDGGEMVAVNVNTLDDVDPRKLSSTHADGRSY